MNERLLEELNRINELQTATAIVDSSRVRAFGDGDQTGRNPVDRGKKRTAFTLVVDTKGTPIVMHAASAMKSDHCRIPSAIAAVRKILGRRKLPRSTPKTVY